MCTCSTLTAALKLRQAAWVESSCGGRAQTSSTHTSVNALRSPSNHPVRRQSVSSSSAFNPFNFKRYPTNETQCYLKYNYNHKYMNTYEYVTTRCVRASMVSGMCVHFYLQCVSVRLCAAAIRCESMSTEPSRTWSSLGCLV
ncbi:unnamed protein product [Ceratitis capitata]|uniref:(Mediterranean fruit fly) hypothetical protein n=1 Tax=Ceratitis capitata TaxID=7213 RepID=A0A811V2B4_CERCA|nr:unnamed protein product [Ceratitis capitata]